MAAHRNGGNEHEQSSRCETASLLPPRGLKGLNMGYRDGPGYVLHLPPFCFFEQCVCVCAVRECAERVHCVHGRLQPPPRHHASIINYTHRRIHPSLHPCHRHIGRGRVLLSCFFAGWLLLATQPFGPTLSSSSPRNSPHSQPRSINLPALRDPRRHSTSVQPILIHTTPPTAGSISLFSTFPSSLHHSSHDLSLHQAQLATRRP